MRSIYTHFVLILRTVFRCTDAKSQPIQANRTTVATIPLKAALILTGMLALSGYLSAAEILFVVSDGNNLDGSESAIRSRLESLEFDVLPISGGDSTSADAEGKALVLISSTIGSGSVADKFLSVATPVLNWEAFIQDDMLMTC